MSEPIKWTNVTLKLSQLKKWENNPAEISKDAAGRLVECFNEFGQIETLAVDPENRLVDGHQRLDTWLAKYGDIEVDCRKASRLLTEKERQKIAVMLRSGAVGRYNWDVVSSWSADDLQGWGLNAETVNDWSRDIAALNELLGSESVEENNYTRNIEAPIYTPKEEKPEIRALYDTAKTDELLQEIEASNIPEVEKEFLRVAARRHTIINYKLVADYYASSNKDTQQLMEKSALVIIDFEKAIELGYVKLSNEIAESYKEDYAE